MTQLRTELQESVLPTTYKRYRTIHSLHMLFVSTMTSLADLGLTADQIIASAYEGITLPCLYHQYASLGKCTEA